MRISHRFPKSGPSSAKKKPVFRWLTTTVLTVKALTQFAPFGPYILHGDCPFRSFIFILQSPYCHFNSRLCELFRKFNHNKISKNRCNITDISTQVNVKLGNFLTRLLISLFIAKLFPNCLAKITKFKIAKLTTIFLSCY